jgi:hypothetical protein
MVLSQLAVNAPAGLISRNRIVLHPPATTVLVKIYAGVGAPLHEFGVESGSVGQGENQSIGSRRGEIRGFTDATLESFREGCQGAMARFETR